MPRPAGPRQPRRGERRGDASVVVSCSAPHATQHQRSQDCGTTRTAEFVRFGDDRRGRRRHRGTAALRAGRRGGPRHDARRRRGGRLDRELDDVGREVLTRHGARSAPQLAYDFPGTTCISVNHDVAHGIPSAGVVLADGDLVNIDVSAELDGYWTDTGASVAVGDPDALTRRLLTATVEAQADGNGGGPRRQTGAPHRPRRRATGPSRRVRDHRQPVRPWCRALHPRGAQRPEHRRDS